MKQRRESPPKTLRRELAAIERAAVNAEKRTVTLSFASEQPVTRWFGAEVLQVDSASVNMTRFENGLGCLLFNHDRNKVLGKVLRAWVDETDYRAHAEVEFDSDEEAQRIWEKVQSGTLRGISVGYGVENWEEVAAGKQSVNGRVAGPAYVAMRWTPYELSVVSVPADDKVGIGREMENEIESEERNMDENTNQTTTATPEQVRTVQAPAAPVATSVDADAIRAAEAQRCADILALCRDFSVDAEPFVRDAKKTIVDVQGAILRQLKEQNKPMGTARAEVGEEDAAKFGRAAVDALLLRDGTIKLDKPADGALDLRSMRLRDLMIECLERSGNTKARHLSDQDMIREALSGTSAFAGILSNAANKSMSAGYAAAETTFQQWVGKGSNPDFKSATHYRLSEAGELKEIKQGGEFEFDEVTEDKAEPWRRCMYRR